jgi:hypothetical protein
MVILLAGKACWSAIGAGAAGTNVLLELGDRVPLRTPSVNPRLSSLQRTYEGEFGLFVECAWRLEAHNQVIVGSGDDSGSDGPISTTLTVIVGRSVISAVVAEGPPDLTLSFTDGLVLKLFCDQGSEEGGWDNYSLRVGDMIVVVGAQGRVRVEKRTAQG